MALLQVNCLEKSCSSRLIQATYRLLHLMLVLFSRKDTEETDPSLVGVWRNDEDAKEGTGCNKAHMINSFESGEDLEDIKNGM